MLLRRAASLARCAARPTIVARRRHRPLGLRALSDEARDAPPTTVVAAGAPGAVDHAIPGTEHGGKKLAIIFTCTVCDTRSAKKFSERSYRHGVVVVKCPGCQNHHLIADNLGFFEDDRWDVEKLAAERGDEINKVDDDNLLGGISPERHRDLIAGTKT